MRLEEAPDLLTRQESAELLRVSLTTLTRLTKAGQLGYVKVGRQVRIPRASLDRYLAGSAPERGPVNPLRDPELSTWPPTESLLSELDRLDGLGRVELNGYGELDAEQLDAEQLDAAERAAGLR